MSKPRIRVNQRGEVRINDGFVNMAANVGTARDKAAHGTYVYVPLHHFELINVYRQSWVAKKAVNIPAEDSTRKWRSWHAETADVSKIEELEKDLKLQQKTMLARVLCRLLGGSALYFSIEGQDPDQPLDLNSVSKGDLKAVTVLTRHQLAVTELNTDPDSTEFMQPLYFTLATPGVNGTIKIHPSRLAIFRGELDPSNTVTWAWGDGILQSTLDTVKQLDSLAANASSLVYEANVDVLSIPRLMEIMAEPDGDMKVAMYLKTVAMMKSNNGMLVLDGGDTSVPEGASGGTKYERKGAQFAGLAELWTKFQQNGAGAFDIPATRFFGMAPAGMNSTGESDLANYHESISSIQSNEIEPAMAILDECLVRSAMGGYNDNVYFEWRPLYEETSDQKVERGKKTADVLTSLKALGVFPTETLQAIAVSAMTETGALPGMEAAVEEHGLELEEDDLLAQQAALGRGAPAGPQAGQAAGGAKPRLSVVAGTATAKQAIKDAAPMSLYVKRDVVNAKEILEHYRKQGATNLLDASELHVTLIYSKTAVDWMTIPTPWSSRIEVNAGGPRLQEVFGVNEPYAQVLLFNWDELQWRNRSLRESGASSDWPDYAPHITLSYGDDLRDMDPWTGEIILGPEVWEEINENYKAKLLGDEAMAFAAIILDAAKGGSKVKGAKSGGHPSDTQPRQPKGHPDGGQFASGTGSWKAMAVDPKDPATRSVLEEIGDKHDGLSPTRVAQLLSGERDPGGRSNELAARDEAFAALSKAKGDEPSIEKPRAEFKGAEGVIKGKDEDFGVFTEQRGSLVNYSIKNAEGHQIGAADYVPAKNRIMSVHVQPEYQRQGIAGQLYDLIESKTGKKLEANETQTDAGQALWASRNRKKLGDKTMGVAAKSKAKAGKVGGHPSDNQPRLPKGHPDGGQFTNKGGAAGGGETFKKEAASAAYYELKKAGGYSFLTQSKIKAYAEGTVKPSNALEQKALDTYHKWAKADPAAVKKANEELGGKFSAAIAAQKAAAQAKKAGAAEAVKQAKADLKAIQEKVKVAPAPKPDAPAPKPVEAKKFAASLDEIGAKHAIGTDMLKGMAEGKIAVPASYSFQQAMKEIKALPGYRAPKPAKGLTDAQYDIIGKKYGTKGSVVKDMVEGKVTPTQNYHFKAVEEAKAFKAQADSDASIAGMTEGQKVALTQLTHKVALDNMGMQPATLLKLASGEWKPEASKPWQFNAVKAYLKGKNDILNPPPPPKPGELSEAKYLSSYDTGKFLKHVDLQTYGGTSQTKVAKIAEGATAQQKSAINTYTGGAYSSINQHLRSGGKPKPEDKLRDEYIKQHKLEMDHDFLRGIDRDAVNALIEANGGVLKKGAVLRDPGFASLTRLPKTAQSFANHESGGYIIKVRAKKGQAVAPVKHISNHPSEDEFLLPTNSRMKVAEIDIDARVIIVDLL